MDTHLGDIEVLLDEYRNIAPLLAKAKAHRIYMEEWKKSQLAILMKKAQESGIKSLGGQETEALSDPAYQITLEGIRAAVEEEERLRFIVRRLEMTIEVWRTQRADERMERKGYGA